MKHIMKYSILSFSFGNYEELREPEEIDEECEYIFVTDNKKLKSDKWNIVYLNETFNDMNSITKTFYVRYHPFDFVNTDTVIILDGSMRIKKSLSKLYNDFIMKNVDCALGTWIESVASQDGMYHYWLTSRGYPKENYIRNRALCKALKFNGADVFHETGYMIYKNTQICKDFLFDVWLSINEISENKNALDRLDQTIFNAVLYSLYPEMKVLNLSRQIIQSDYIKYESHKNGENKNLKVKLNDRFEKKYGLYHI